MCFGYSPFASDSDVCKERLHLFSEEARKTANCQVGVAKAH